MNPATAFARVLVDELLRGGVTDAVLAPGSRSAPVALALAAAERAGRLRLHVRIDERTAAFLALGLAKASGRPVPVLTTSGTAAAHLHAAVLEADASGVPLLALTADRPPELRATGANQTIEQPGLYGGAVRWAADVGVPEAGREEAQNRYWRSLVAKALLTATGALDRNPGPVHLNLGAARAADARRRGARRAAGPLGRPPGRRTVDRRSPDAGRVLPGRSLAAADARGRRRRPAVLGPGRRAELRGWPAGRWSPSRRSGAWTAGARAAARCCSARAGWLAAHRPERVVVVGRPTLSRPVSALLADPASRWRPPPSRPRWAGRGPVAARPVGSGCPGGAVRAAPTASGRPSGGRPRRAVGRPSTPCSTLRRA